MAQPAAIRCQIQFGPFTADLRTRELLKYGIHVKLQDRPFDILVMLLEHPGEIVTREEMRARLWPDGTFVDFDNNISSAIGKLRAALGDSAAEPRYIETVGRGYRFLADVKLIPAPVSSLPESAAAGPELISAGTTVAPAAGAPVPRRPWIRPAVLACLVASAAAIGYWQWSWSQVSSRAVPGRMMLAVLPFANLTGEAGQDYFSEGLTEEMITQLGRLDPQLLGVIARTSVMRYKDSRVSLPQIGAELGVQYVLEGSVRRQADHVRITAQLIRVRDQTHIWAREYDRELKDLLAVQTEIAEEIGGEIEVDLGARQSKHAAVQRSLSPQELQAYDLYLKGEYFLAKRTVPDLQKATDFLQQATARDPHYARAYAGLADSYALLGGYSAAPQTEFIAKARAAALRALDLDNRLPDAHTALALIVQNYDWDWQAAEKEFHRAIELDPNYVTAHHWYGEHLMWRGRFDEALQESERARQLDPLSLIIASDNGAILYFARQYDRAIEKWRSVREMDPDFLRAHLIIAAYIEKGMFAEALADNERLRPRIPAPSYWSWCAYIHGRAGQRADAQRAIRELLQMERRSPIDPMVIAQAYLGVGDKDQTFAWLEKAYAQHSSELTSLKVNPIFDPLRSDERFRDLVRRVGLGQSHP